MGGRARTEPEGRATAQSTGGDAVPEPASAVREMIRVSRTAGVVASYVWDHSGEMQPLRTGMLSLLSSR